MDARDADLDDLGEVFSRSEARGYLWASGLLTTALVGMIGLALAFDGSPMATGEAAWVWLAGAAFFIAFAYLLVWNTRVAARLRTGSTAASVTLRDFSASGGRPLQPAFIRLACQRSGWRLLEERSAVAALIPPSLIGAGVIAVLIKFMA